jgi:hypothetical protein
MAAELIPTCEVPADFNVSIWRYMDFTKFVSMLIKRGLRGLFFPRLDCLGDPFEGSFPKLNMDDDLYPVHPSILDPKGYRKSLKGMRQCVKHRRQWVYASCWYMSEHESPAMWKLYARTEEAVCIRSTFLKLQQSLPNQALIGCIKYINFEKEFFNDEPYMTPYVIKRLSFEHEREVRALIDNEDWWKSWCVEMGVWPKSTKVPSPIEGGIWQEVDLAKLIDKVYVAPTAPNWFKETVEQTIQKFDFKFPVVQSSLDDSPDW